MNITLLDLKNDILKYIDINKITKLIYDLKFLENNECEIIFKNFKLYCLDKYTTITNFINPFSGRQIIRNGSTYKRLKKNAYKTINENIIKIFQKNIDYIIHIIIEKKGVFIFPDKKKYIIKDSVNDLLYDQYYLNIENSKLICCNEKCSNFMHNHKLIFKYCKKCNKIFHIQKENPELYNIHDLLNTQLLINVINKLNSYKINYIERLYNMNKISFENYKLQIPLKLTLSYLSKNIITNLIQKYSTNNFGSIKTFINLLKNINPEYYIKLLNYDILLNEDNTIEDNMFIISYFKLNYSRFINKCFSNLQNEKILESFNKYSSLYYFSNERFLNSLYESNFKKGYDILYNYYKKHNCLNNFIHTINIMNFIINGIKLDYKKILKEKNINFELKDVYDRKLIHYIALYFYDLNDIFELLKLSKPKILNLDKYGNSIAYLIWTNPKFEFLSKCELLIDYFEYTDTKFINYILDKTDKFMIPRIFKLLRIDEYMLNEQLKNKFLKIKFSFKYNIKDKERLEISEMFGLNLYKTDDMCSITMENCDGYLFYSKNCEKKHGLYPCSENIEYVYKNGCPLCRKKINHITDICNNKYFY